jgi:repressor LexA
MTTMTTESRTADGSVLSVCGGSGNAGRPDDRPRDRPDSRAPGLAVNPDQPDRAQTLTSRQRKVLKAIEELQERRGYPPTLREIAKAAGLASLSTVSYHLSSLQAKGYLRRDTGRPRTAVLRPLCPVAEETPVGVSSREVVRVAMVGQIAAGSPILAQESIEDTFPLPRQLVGEGTLFLLRVVGDSMIQAAITDGDWVVIRQQPVAENGEIVAAMIDGEATIKMFKRSGDHLWLVPQSPVHTPIMADDAIILGKVVVVLRRL